MRVSAEANSSATGTGLSGSGLREPSTLFTSAETPLTLPSTRCPWCSYGPPGITLPWYRFASSTVTSPEKTARNTRWPERVVSSLVWIGMAPTLPPPRRARN